jgi:hypothetical protein
VFSQPAVKALYILPPIESRHVEFNVMQALAGAGDKARGNTRLWIRLTVTSLSTNDVAVLVGDYSDLSLH